MLIPLAILGALTLIRDELWSVIAEAPPPLREEYTISALLRFLPHWPPERWGMIGLVIAIIFILHGSYRQYARVRDKLSSKVDERHYQHFKIFEREHDDLREYRTRYWWYIHRDYKWARQNEKEWPDNLEEVIEKAEFPSEVMGTSPLEWARKQKTSYDAILWTVAQRIYPSQSVKSMLEGAEFDEFHNCEGRLSNFWQKIGGWAFATQELKPDALLAEDRYFPSQCKLLKLLIYFEIALMLSLNQPGPGKQRMMQIYVYAKQHGQC